MRVLLLRSPWATRQASAPSSPHAFIAMDDIRDAAHLVVIGDRRILDEGAACAGLTLDLD